MVISFSVPCARALPAALLLASLGSSGCVPASRPNILFILVDTLRPDHLGAYGYERATSPAIDRLSEEGILFERFYSVAPWTNPTIATLFTGLYPQSVLPPAPHKQAVKHQLPTAVETLPEVLRRSGYRTVALIDHPGINRRLGFARGFDEFRFLFAEEGVSAWRTSASPKFVLDAFEDALANPGDDPFFIYLHLIYPHRPYLPQPAYRGRFGKGSHGTKGSRGKSRAERQALINSYDAEIRQTDDLLGRIFESLVAKGLSDETAIIFTSDHGEGFWEHGLAEHGRSFFDELIRIPLVIVPPGGRAGAPAVVARPASNIDLFSTVLDFAGVEAAAEAQGRSLSRFFDGSQAPEPDVAEWFFSESPHSKDVHTSAMLSTDGLKYIHSPGKRRTNLLFDLSVDAAELDDLATSREITAYRSMLDEHRRRNRATRDQWIIEEVEVDDETIEQLEALGYVD